MRVFLTGGTGRVGSRLVTALRGRGDECLVLTRSSGRRDEPSLRYVVGDPTLPGPWTAALDGCDAAINLAGEDLFARRWTDEVKQRIRASRVKATETLVAALREPGRPRVLVSGSAVGYYGTTGGDRVHSEASPPGDDFLARVCVEWEAATQPAIDAGIRVVSLRTGVVLDRRGGMLPQLLTPFKLFLGGPAGSGDQWLSWVHHADLCGLIRWCLDRDDVTGPLNATAPRPVTNRDFSAALARALGRPSWLPAPAFGLKLMFGEMAEVILGGQRVLPDKALDRGFAFHFSEVESAIRDCLAESERAATSSE